MIRLALILAALLSISMSGCGTMRGGETVVKFDANQHPILSEVRSSGTYQLFATTDFNPQVTVDLKEGDPLLQDGRDRAGHRRGRKPRTPPEVQ